MRVSVVIVGAAIVAVGVFGVAHPDAVVRAILDWPEDLRFYVAVISRILLGTVLVAAAPRCRFPRVVYVLGWLAFVSAATVIVLGPARVDVLVRWWFRQSGPLLRSSYAVAVLLGVFLVHAGTGRPAR